MSQPGPSPTPSPAALLLLTARSVLGGVLMGLANLVPGISGGTMLLAAGVYPAFVGAVADLTTLRLRLPSLLVLACIVASAAGGILLLAGPVKDLVVEQRWIMYSLFIGLTLGGVPLVWRLARPPNASVVLAAVPAFLMMAAMAWLPASETCDGDRAYGMLVLAGLAGAGAMVLPGISGGYLLLLLGQYVPILDAADQVRGSLSSSGIDFARLTDALHVVVPVMLGVVIGVVAVSNLMRWLLAHHRRPVLGILLGLLVGAVVGLWPFQEGVEPLPGDTVKCQVVTAGNLAAIDRDDWPVRAFSPSAGQMGAALGLILAGLAITLAIGRLGGSGEDTPEAPDASDRHR